MKLISMPGLELGLEPGLEPGLELGLEPGLKLGLEPGLELGLELRPELGKLQAVHFFHRLTVFSCEFQAFLAETRETGNKNRDNPRKAAAC